MAFFHTTVPLARSTLYRKPAMSGKYRWAPSTAGVAVTWPLVSSDHFRLSRPTEVAVAVTNTGAGIPAAELPHLFQRFRRVNDPAHGAIKGIGLGLYIVQQLVEAHGGKIQAESTPGQTTTFRFTLPCSQPATA